MATAPQTRPSMRLVFSYAREDEDLRDRLETHLQPLERAGLISCWHDREIRAGRNWREQIEQAIRQADIILLLISPDFIASDFCFTIEMATALKRHATSSALVIPVLLRPVVAAVGQGWAELQSLPRDLRAVMLWRNLDEALATVAREVLEALEGWCPARLPSHVALPVQDEGTAEERVLDAAVPSHVRVGQTSEVVALVRRPESGGLRAILAADHTFAAQPQAVRSQEFDLEFPRDHNGRPLPLRLTLVLWSPDLNPPWQSKRIQVPPSDDSPTYVFLGVPRRPGLLTFQIELLAGDVSIVTHLLRSQAEEAAVTDHRYVVATMPLVTLSLGARTTTTIARPSTTSNTEPPAPTSVPEASHTGAILIPPSAAAAPPRPRATPSSVEFNPALGQRRVDEDTREIVTARAVSYLEDAKKITISRLVLIKDDGTEASFPLTRDSYTLGRHTKNDIVISDPKVSSFHARIDLSPEGYVLVDLKSRNGCWLNGKAVDTALLKGGDELRMGLARLVYKIDYTSVG
jgi:hypothetical protein